MLRAVRALALTINFGVYGVPATVTRPAPDDVPIETTLVWLPLLTEDRPVNSDIHRRDPRRVLALRRTDVSHAPRGTLIAAPELGGATTKTWRVEGIDRMDADHIRLIVGLVA
jgi:hypothetical protein